MFNVVLYEPEIPGNTENIGRTCVCTGTKLHLIEPLGFRLDKKNTRAGLDYWERVDYMNFVEFIYKNGLEDCVRLDEEYVSKYQYIIEEIERARKLTPTKLNGGTHEVCPYEQCSGGNLPPGKQVASPTVQNNVVANCAYGNIFFLTTKGHKTYADVKFNDGDYLVFGKESAGIPEEILSLNEDKCIRIPMIKEERSLNLANSVNIVLYEALRQNNFLDLEKKGELHRLKYI